MLIIDRHEGESIERMLKRYKNKQRDTSLVKQIRNRKHFTKPSVERRAEILKAAYVEKRNKNLAK